MTARHGVGVVIGALGGAAARWGSAEVVGPRPGLLLVNIVGCAVMGWALGHGVGAWLTAGTCGALTSFSALALQLAQDLDAGDVGPLVLWLVLTVVGCWVGFTVGRHLVPRSQAT